MAATTGIPAIEAGAATIEVPGIRNFDVQVGPEHDHEIRQLNRFLNDHSDQINQMQQALAPVGVQDAAPGPGIFPQMLGIFEQSRGAQAFNAAKTRVGAEYVWGGSGPWAFDCSGFTKWAYEQVGVKLPRTSFEQSHVGRPIASQDLQPGDLVIQSDGGHVAMYAGNGQILHAPQAGESVTYAPLRPDSIVTARRVV
jgi:hypothetical protein